MSTPRAASMSGALLTPRVTDGQRGFPLGNSFRKQLVETKMGAVECKYSVACQTRSSKWLEDDLYSPTPPESEGEGAAVPKIERREGRCKRSLHLIHITQEGVPHVSLG